MNVQKLISEISQAQKQSSLLTVNRTMQIEEGTRRKDITEKQIFTYVHSDTTNNNKGKNIKKTLQTIVSHTPAAVTKILQGYFQMKEILLLQ